MNRILLITLGMILMAGNIFAQAKKEKDEMVFEKTVNGETKHDFGSIVYDAEGSVDFVFTNKGSKPLVITNVTSTCGCTVPTWPKEPIEPGEQGAIKVVYNTKLPGTFNKTIVVYSNANNSPIRISVLGKVGPRPGGKKGQNVTNNTDHPIQVGASTGKTGSSGSDSGLPPAKQKKKELHKTGLTETGKAAATKNTKEGQAVRIK